MFACASAYVYMTQYTDYQLFYTERLQHHAEACSLFHESLQK